MSKKVAISQSNYIPWKGYFDLIASVDVFVIYDDMQYTKRDWRNRNKIKTPNGTAWLSVPVQVKGRYHQRINEVEVSNHEWRQNHWAQISNCYKKATHFGDIEAWLKPLYLDKKDSHLSSINRYFIDAVCSYLGIRTLILDSRDFELVDGKSEKLLGVCQNLQASHYVSGPAAQAYLDEGLFDEAGVKVNWFDYTGYPEYEQQWGAFEHSVTILDLLFNAGTESSRYLKNL